VPIQEVLSGRCQSRCQEDNKQATRRTQQLGSKQEKARTERSEPADKARGSDKARESVSHSDYDGALDEGSSDNDVVISHAIADDESPNCCREEGSDV
jgi:hypothetical protein